MKQFQHHRIKGLRDRQTRDARSTISLNVLQHKMATPVSRCFCCLQSASLPTLLPSPVPPAKGHGFACCPKRLFQLTEEIATEENTETS